MSSVVLQRGAARQILLVRRTDVIRFVVTYVVLLSGSFVLLIPFAFMLSTSLKTLDQIYTWPIQWIPHPFAWQNYPEVFEIEPLFLRYIINTVIVTFFGIIGNLFGSTHAAYSFARLRYPGRRFLFLVMISTMMVPGWVTLIPTFLLFKAFGWVNTYFPLIVPAFAAQPFYTFLLRQFFLTIPTELEDAARIDGASAYGCFARIILPLTKPALATVAIFSFFFHWNDFLAPLIYLQDQEKFTIPLGIAAFQGDVTGAQFNFALMMAAATIALLPCVVLFFLAQRLFIQGIVITGVKG